MSQEPADEGGREILFEFVRLGVQVRVAAVDSATGAEAVIIGPANAARMDLERLAVRKLMRLIGQGDAKDDEVPPKGEGWIV